MSFCHLKKVMIQRHRMKKESIFKLYGHYILTDDPCFYPSKTSKIKSRRSNVNKGKQKLIYFRDSDPRFIMFHLLSKM